MQPGRFGAILIVAGAMATAVPMAGCGPCTSSPGACASNDTVSAADDEDLVCRNEPLTGSHIIERRCYRRSDIEARRARDIAVMERLIIQANRPIRNPAAGTPNPH